MRSEDERRGRAEFVGPVLGVLEAAGVVARTAAVSSMQNSQPLAVFIASNMLISSKRKPSACSSSM